MTTAAAQPTLDNGITSMMPTTQPSVIGSNRPLHSIEEFADRLGKKLGQHYGVPIRRINYKKLAILYSIEDDTVIIESILPQKMIK